MAPLSPARTFVAIGAVVIRRPGDIVADHRGLRRALIVTALDVETRAVLAHLSMVGTASGRHGTVYECGRFRGEGSEWLVVVTQCGPGNHPAQHIVTDAHADFKRLEVLLFVGVGGSLKEDVPIGSVVAANAVHNVHSGKEGEGGFTARPRSEPVEHRLVQLAYKVARDGVWRGRICAPLGGELPGTAHYPTPFPPKAVVGPIASIEQVLANPRSELAERIAKHYGDAQAVEMEGYGAMFAAGRRSENTPATVIRGISDMARDKAAHTDAARQPAAASHAAAFGLELLDLWGQANRSPERPPRPLDSGGGIAAGNPKPPASPGQGPARASVRDKPPPEVFVLSLDRPVAEPRAEGLAAMEATLREITGDPDLRVTGTEANEFHLFVEARPELLASIDEGALRGALADRHAVALLGLVTQAAHRRVLALKEAICPASRDVLGWPRLLPDGTWIDRPELGQLEERIASCEMSATALLGPPGSGKSALLSAFAEAVAGRGWPVLAIKADLLDPSVATEEDLQRQLALPEAPGAALELLAAVGPVVLVIDQFDALAGYVDLRTSRLNVLLNLVRRFGKRRNVHVVVSARTFEYEHDVRLRTIEAESVALALPGWGAVLECLERHGVDAQGWPADAQEVLRHPQALSIFLGLRDGVGAEPFHTYQAMLDRLWSDRILAAPNGPGLARLASDVAEAMSEEECLWLPAARFEDRQAEMRALEGLGILATSAAGGAVGFRHQTLFDHALARGFARGRGRLSGHVLGRQASLFVRPKLWAGLAYLRGVAPAAYHAELLALWTAEALRRHLRLLLVDFLGQQKTPSDQEAALLTPVLASDDRHLAFRAVQGSPGWFERLAGNGALALAMIRDEATAWMAAGVLGRAWPFAQDAVERLLSDHWGSAGAFDSQMWSVLEDCPHWTGGTLELAIGILARSDIPILRVNHVASTLGVAQPGLALRVVRAKLDRDLAAAKLQARARLTAEEQRAPDGGDLAAQVAWEFTRSPRRPFKELLDKSGDWDSLPALAESAPGAYVDVLWPWYLDLFAAIREAEAPRGRGLVFAVAQGVDLDVDRAEAGTDRPWQPALLSGVRIAVEHLAAEEPDAFLVWSSANGAEDAVPVQRLIAHGLASQSERYAEQTLRFLLDDPRRFRVGDHRAPHGTTTRLMRRAGAYWSAEDVRGFERAIAAYAPAPPGSATPEERRAFSLALRSARQTLLTALPKDRLSLETKRTVIEEARVFPDGHDEVAEVEARFIGSPMSAQAMAKAGDDDIVRAFAAVPDATGWNHPKQWDKGGNIQLSRAFADFAKEEPGRAVRLMGRFGLGTGERAAGYALEALAEAAEPELVLSAFLDLARRGFGSEEYRAPTARAVVRLVDREVAVGEDVVAVLEGWLAESPDGGSGRGAAIGAADDDASEAGPVVAGPEGPGNGDAFRSILWDASGVALLPHGNYPVLEALTRVLLARGEHDRLAGALERHLARPEDAKVWEAMLRLVPYVRPSDPARRGDLVRSIFAKYPELLRTGEAAHLLARAQWWAPDAVHALIQGWPRSFDPWLRQAFGELVALVAIVQPALAWAGEFLAEVVADTGASEARGGAAYSAANLWNQPGRRDAAARLLSDLVPGAGRQVWTGILDLFRMADELTPDAATVQVLTAVADHADALRGMPAGALVDRLQTLLPHEAPLVARLARALVAGWREELRDVRTATAASAPQLVDIAVTLHRLGPATREAGTALFEDLLDLDAYSARQTLDEIDAKFQPERRQARPRLPRRHRGGPRTLRPA